MPNLPATISLSPTFAPALPSASSALALMNGEPGSLPLVMAHTAIRAGIIGTGLYVAGHRCHLLRTALVSSLAIEAFVLGWAAYQRGRANNANNVPPVI
jgi:hypothetical protein